MRTYVWMVGPATGRQGGAATALVLRTYTGMTVT